MSNSRRWFPSDDSCSTSCAMQPPSSEHANFRVSRKCNLTSKETKNWIFLKWRAQQKWKKEDNRKAGRTIWWVLRIQIWNLYSWTTIAFQDSQIRAIYWNGEHCLLTFIQVANSNSGNGWWMSVHKPKNKLVHFSFSTTRPFLVGRREIKPINTEFT